VNLQESLGRPVSEYASASFARVEATDSVSRAARVMKDGGATEAIVFRDSEPVGVITERDILYKVVAEGENPSITKVHEVMSSPVQTIDEGAKVSDAIAKMSRLGLRRLGVTKRGIIVGIITQKAVVTGNVEQNFPLPELAVPSGFACPYCSTALKTKEDLSKHIDRVHAGGVGLLQGDVTKW